MDLRYGEEYTWKDVAGAYPDMWLFMTDVAKKNGAIDRFRFLAVCSHADKIKYMRKFRSEGIPYECERTTFSVPNLGALC
jgi:hypothetical protein